jgi:hypothetical protein
MSERALGFVEEWIAEHIDGKADAPDGDGDGAQAKACAAQCLQAAQAQGISELEIKESIENLTEFMAAAIEEAGERGPGDDLADEDD